MQQRAAEAPLHCIERTTPLLEGCVAGDLGRKCTVDGKVLVDEAIELCKNGKVFQKRSPPESRRQ